MGFEAKEQKRVRVSFQNYKGLKLNTQRRASSKTLREKKYRMIESGELEAGKMIVPITYQVLSIGEDGRLVCRKMSQNT